MSTFRVLVLCGEVVTVELRNRIMEVAPPDVALWNLYSISECHDVSAVDLTKEMYDDPSRTPPVRSLFGGRAPTIQMSMQSTKLTGVLRDV